MKRLNNKLSYTLYFVLVAVLSSCGTEPKENIEQEIDNREIYIVDGTYDEVQIIKVRNCEYVFWHKCIFSYAFRLWNIHNVRNQKSPILN